jgi:hypothetical protein
MFRNTVVAQLTDLETGDFAGYALQVGCMTLYVPTEEGVRRALVAIANDPEGHEKEFYARQRKHEERKKKAAEQVWKAAHTHRHEDEDSEVEAPGRYAEAADTPAPQTSNMVEPGQPIGLSGHR